MGKEAPAQPLYPLGNGVLAIEGHLCIYKNVYVRERRGVEVKGRERKERKGREPGGKVNFGLCFCVHCIMYQALY